MPDAPVPVALARATCYASLANQAGETLDASGISPRPGDRVLVKPNLLMAHALSCASPQVVAAACKWLLDHNVKITVADSPAFGTARSVARAIGLEAALAPLGLTVTDYTASRSIWLRPAGSRPIRAGVAVEALDCDFILSIPRVKAHSQVRLTLAVKNCFGCLRGLRKALAHAPLNLELPLFADRVAALWAALPPVAALADGITAMSVTGPRHGEPFALGAIGASSSAPALDEAFIHILGLDPQEIPLSAALRRRAASGHLAACPASRFPLLATGDLAVTGFIAPRKLRDISFNPLTLARSMARRLWKSLS